MSNFGHCPDPLGFSPQAPRKTLCVSRCFVSLATRVLVRLVTALPRANVLHTQPTQADCCMMGVAPTKEIAKRAPRVPRALPLAGMGRAHKHQPDQ
ncbi:MAG: hypothetical protein ACJA1R_001604 [Flavobacteriales bacterium]|jgi:hypothetical protein